MSGATISEPTEYAADQAFENDLRALLEDNAEFKSDSDLDEVVAALRSNYFMEKIKEG